jgi:hypothetical protein
VAIGECSYHRLHRFGVSGLAADRLGAAHVRDHLRMVYRLHSGEVASIEGVITLLHERKEVCCPAEALDRDVHANSFF